MPPRMDFWTEQRVETLTGLWSQGLACSAIAERMGGGLSRGAIIGKVHRLKLKRSTGYENEPNNERPAPRQKTVASRSFRRSVFKSREKKPALAVRNPRARPPLVMVMSAITGNPLAAKRMRPYQPEMTKNELRSMLRTAVQNTADLGDFT